MRAAQRRATCACCVGAHHDRGLAVKALQGNKLSVLRVDGTEVAKKPCDLTVVDRSFLYPGMAVTSALDTNSGQPGVVTGVTTALDLVQLDEPTVVVATGVSPAEVRPVKELTVGDYVVSGPWLGRVVELSVDVDVLFDDDRSVCRVTGAGDKLRVLDKGYLNSNKNDFFPGDGVAGDASVFKASRWLKGHWKPTRGEGTVAKVEMGGVLVYWVASLQLGTDMDAVQASVPPAYQPNSHNLTFFCSGDATLLWLWGVGNRCFFRRRSPPTPSPASSGGPKKKKLRRHGMGMGVKRRPRVHAGRAEFEQPVAVVDTRTTADVLWQDGTRQRGVPSASLHRFLVRNEQDFFPGQRVISKQILSPVSDVAAGRAAVGVVKSLSYKDQTVCVSWIPEESGEEVAVDRVDTVMMSTYDLARSLDHNFFYGAIVVRLRPTADHQPWKRQ
ncbi:hypothetical protein C2845_PM06G29530 [Panicum miliaceum]|uniref:Uncharacterized protein n=1 Tax=Panicum miliaceum TaxID=4540 RepID=A0A3L6R7H4_PANMI|nr:hypothetical protein C2845_PM06G29530 [Panicum miliaceum]